MRIAVFGLGYVGCVTAACLAARGNTVIGVDVAAHKVSAINTGRSPIIEAGLNDLIATSVLSGALSATSRAAEAIDRSELSLVCVGTPSNTNGSLRLEFIERVAADIGAALVDTSRYHLVVFRSTMLPGTVEDILVPILSRVSGRQLGRDFGIAYHPEFLREGSAIQDFESPPKIVVGESEGSSAQKLVELYDGFRAPLIRTSIRVAETVKYVDNVFHALKISFANEVENICRAVSVDGHEVMRIFCEDRLLKHLPGLPDAWRGIRRFLPAGRICARSSTKHAATTSRFRCLKPSALPTINRRREHFGWCVRQVSVE